MTDPQLSIIIASHNPGPPLGLCLEALLAEPGIGQAELIMADSSEDGTAEMIQNRFPSIHFQHFDAPMTVPELRGKAIAAAKGEIIAILDPYAIVEKGWLAAVIRLHQEYPNWIIGGLVDIYEPQARSLLDWAVYINEYGMFMPPLPPGEMEILAGSNISYKRLALFEGDKPRQAVFWKTFANWAAETAGQPLRLAPEMVVYLYKPVPFWDFLRTRFHHGRCFAGMRLTGASIRQRLFRTLTAPLLPFLLLWRWGSRYWTKGRRRGKLLLTLPLQLLFFGSWALGEMVGYLSGTGRSCRELFY